VGDSCEMTKSLGKRKELEGLNYGFSLPIQIGQREGVGTGLKCNKEVLRKKRGNGPSFGGECSSPKERGEGGTRKRGGKSEGEELPPR